MADGYIAAQGCIHGEIDECYKAIEKLIPSHKIRALLWCGDVQCVRDEDDLESLACPPKYRQMHDFHKYYKGLSEAPVLTIFAGGNHEASSFLHLLYFGGWVAPKMFYAGRSSVLNIAGLRIAFLSGIYKGYNYNRGYFEALPLDEDSKRSIYHVREQDVQKLLKIQGPVDVVVSHDWPSGIVQNDGDRHRLTQKKPYFKNDLSLGQLGNPESMKILHTLKPKVWLAAHLHVNFSCEYKHSDGSVTKFMAHDKIKGGRVPTSLLDEALKDIKAVRGDREGGSATTVERETKKARVDQQDTEKVYIDLEWMSILKETVSVISNSDAKATHVAESKTCDKVELAKHLASRMPDAESLLTNDDRKPHEIQFPLPDWTVLRYQDACSQTRWWLDMIGIDSREFPSNLLQPEKNPLLDD